LKPLLSSLLGPSIALIDSAEQTAAAVSRELASSTLHAPTTATSRVHFVVSDAPKQFVRVGKMFLGDAVKDVETVPLGL
jgi:glutamate racemase